MTTPLQGTQSAAGAIERVKYTHDAMIDLIIARPGIKQNELAAHFGYTEPWVSRIINSDAFQARLAQRKTEMVDPSIAASIDEKLRTAASVSLDVLVEKLQVTRNPDLATKVADISTRALGYGARAANVAVQNNFVVALPPKAKSASEWALAHAPQPVVDVPAAEVHSAASSH